MTKLKKSTRNRFSKAVEAQFLIDFSEQTLSITDYISYLNENGLNKHFIKYDSANRLLQKKNIPNRSTKSSRTGSRIQKLLNNLESLSLG